jgi:hypothetical protein
MQQCKVEAYVDSLILETKNYLEVFNPFFPVVCITESVGGDKELGLL